MKIRLSLLITYLLISSLDAQDSIPREVINTLNRNVFKERILPWEDYPNYFESKHKSDMLSQHCFVNGELRLVYSYDEVGRLSSKISYKEGLMDDFYLYQYDDNDELVKRISDYNVVEFEYYGDSLIRAKIESFPGRRKWKSTNKYTYSDTVNILQRKNRMSGDTSLRKNFLDSKGNVIRQIDFQNQDTFTFVKYHYDSLDRVCFYEKYSYNDGRREPSRFFCHSKMWVQYDKETGLICRKMRMKKCNTDLEEWNRTDYHYSREFRIKKGLVTDVKVTYERNDKPVKIVNYKFNEKHDIIWNNVENLLKNEVYEYDYKNQYR